MREVYDILREPSGPDYRELVQWCGQHATRGMLVVRDLGIGSVDAEFLARLHRLGSTVVVAQKWPGTILLGGDYAHLLLFPINPDTIACLCETVGSLYMWLGPSLPEDLCFLRDDGADLLATISHERDAYLTLSRTELLELPTGNELAKKLRLRKSDR